MKQQLFEIKIPAQQVIWVAMDSNQEFWIKLMSWIDIAPGQTATPVLSAVDGYYAGFVPPTPFPASSTAGGSWFDGNSFPLPSTGSASPSPMDISITYVQAYVNEFERTIEVDNSSDYTITDQYTNQWGKIQGSWFRQP